MKLKTLLKINNKTKIILDISEIAWSANRKSKVSRILTFIALECSKLQLRPRMREFSLGTSPIDSARGDGMTNWWRY